MVQESDRIELHLMRIDGQWQKKGKLGKGLTVILREHTDDGEDGKVSIGVELEVLPKTNVPCKDEIKRMTVSLKRT